MGMAICLFSADRHNVVDSNGIAATQHHLALVLQNYCNSDLHPAKGSKRTCVSQIIGLLTTLRTLNSYILQTINRKMSTTKNGCNSPSSLSSGSSNSSECDSSEPTSTNESTENSS